MAIEISKPLDKKYLSQQFHNFEEYALYDKLQDTSGVDYWRRRYRRLEDTFEYAVNTQYYIGNLVTHDDCLYAATVNNNDAAWDSTHWKMVGAKSIIQIVDNALPNPLDLKEDSVIILKNNEMDTTVAPATVKHSKGIWIFDKTSMSYTQYHEYESANLDLSEVWNSSAVSTYTGDANKVVNSKYLYDNLKSFGDKVADEISDLYDIVGTPTYIVLDTKDDLDNYDLTTLADNSVAIFLIKSDSVHPIPGTAPVENYSTLYVCICDDDGKTRQAVYVGHLNFGAVGIDAMIHEIVDNEVKITIPAHYEKVTSGTSGALTIVADGTSPLGQNEIELSSVNPVLSGYTPVVGDEVIYKNASISNEYKFMEKKDYDTTTLKSVSHKEIVYSDPLGVDPSVTVDCLSYNNKAVLYNEFENVDIDFTDPAQFTPVM